MSRRGQVPRRHFIVPENLSLEEAKKTGDLHQQITRSIGSSGAAFIL